MEGIRYTIARTLTAHEFFAWFARLGCDDALDSRSVWDRLTLCRWRSVWSFVCVVGNAMGGRFSACSRLQRNIAWMRLRQSVHAPKEIPTPFCVLGR